MYKRDISRDGILVCHRGLRVGARKWLNEYFSIKEGFVDEKKWIGIKSGLKQLMECAVWQRPVTRVARAMLLFVNVQNRNGLADSVKMVVFHVMATLATFTTT